MLQKDDGGRKMVNINEKAPDFTEDAFVEKNKLE